MANESFVEQTIVRARAIEHIARRGEVAIEADQSWEAEIRAYIIEIGIPETVATVAFNACRWERDLLIGQFANNREAAQRQQSASEQV